MRWGSDNLERGAGMKDYPRLFMPLVAVLHTMVSFGSYLSFIVLKPRSKEVKIEKNTNRFSWIYYVLQSGNCMSLFLPCQDLPATYGVISVG